MQKFIGHFGSRNHEKWTKYQTGVRSGARAVRAGVSRPESCRSKLWIRANSRPPGPTHAHPTNWILDPWAMDPCAHGSVDPWSNGSKGLRIQKACGSKRPLDPKALWIQKAPWVSRYKGKGTRGTKVQG